MSRRSWCGTPHAATGVPGAQRQQQFLEAFRQRALKLNAIAHLPDIAANLESEVRTDMSLPGDAQALWSDQGKLRQNGVLHVSLNSGNLLYVCTCDANGYTLHPYVAEKPHGERYNGQK